jgi:hypothetical protein
MACPSHLECINGWCQEPGPASCAADGGIIDPDINPHDGPGTSLCAPPTQLGNDSLLTSGESLTARLTAETYAVKIAFEIDAGGNLIGVTYGTRGDVGSSDPNWSFLFQDDTLFQYRNPKLAPGGLEMFVLIEPLMTGVPQIGRASRTPQSDTWTAPQPITVMNTLVSYGSYPSSPTTTNPRRMVIAKDTQGWAEVQELSPGTWSHVRTQGNSYTTSANELVMFLGQAHMTEEGRRLVFRGQIEGQNVGAFYLERASLADPFVSPARQLPTGGSAGHPFLTSDCRYLFYNRDATNSVYRVVYP